MLVLVHVLLVTGMYCNVFGICFLSPVSNQNCLLPHERRIPTTACNFSCLPKQYSQNTPTHLFSALMLMVLLLSQNMRKYCILGIIHGRKLYQSLQILKVFLLLLLFPN